MFTRFVIFSSLCQWHGACLLVAQRTMLTMKLPVCHDEKRKDGEMTQPINNKWKK